MKYYSAKIASFDGIVVRFTACFSLDDDCKNGVCHFSITGTGVVQRGKRGYYKKGDYFMGGCCDEEIKKLFPDLAGFIPLHGSNEFGQPLYPIENFIYHIQQHEDDTKIRLMYRVTEDQLEELKMAAVNKDLFKYKLYELGVIRQWKREANEAIAWLEEHTGKSFAHTPNPKFTLEYSDEWLASMKGRIASGEFTKDSIEKHYRLEHQKWQEQELAKTEEEYNRQLLFLQKKRELQEWIIKNTPTKNYSFFAYNGLGYEKNPKYELKLNYRNYDPQITDEEYKEFASREDIPGCLTVINGDR